MSVRDKRLYLEDLTVSFDGFKALNELSLYVDPGELLCIIGPNGVTGAVESYQCVQLEGTAQLVLT